MYMPQPGFTALSFQLATVGEKRALKVPMPCNYLSITNTGPDPVTFWPQQSDVAIDIPSGASEQVTAPFFPLEEKKSRFVQKEVLGDLSLKSGAGATVVVRFVM